ncbi:MAG: tyrosine-protein kinase [Solirubrobacteraceae bacterium]|jgi:capsular exopolysaccharide synthesis family protein|nr:capsular exopolysaccharide family [Solirubrobacterales bacterium]MEA2214482.1 tyrosine-protein kinase [Solirubrobacteraceae bacterium]
MRSDTRFEPPAESNSISTALEVLRRRWPLALGIVLVCTVISAIQQKRATPTYKASASVALQHAPQLEQIIGSLSSGSGEPQRDINTEVTIAHSPEVAQGVRTQLGNQLSVGELLSIASVEAAPNAEVLDITASTGDPRESARIANAFANQFITFRANQQLNAINAVKNQLQQQLNAAPAGSAEAGSLQSQIQRLAQARAAVSAGASIIGRATPPGSPSGMRLSTAVILGLVIGLALAFTLLFLLESLDRRIKTVEDFEREYRLSALTVVPQSSMGPVRADERSELLEPFRILRSALEFAAVTRAMDTLLITSAVPGEGKTTVSVDLAQAIALTKRRVVLLELDLRMPTFARHFGLDPRRGLTTALLRGEAPADLLVEPLPDVPNLSVLPSGPLPHNPSELLASPVIGEIISELGNNGETMVIIDAPPLNPVADAQILLNSSAVQATLVIARLNKTTRDEVRRARAILDRHMVEPIGLVITGMRDGGRYSYSAYGEGVGTVDVNAERASRRSRRSTKNPLPL